MEDFANFIKRINESVNQPSPDLLALKEEMTKVWQQWSAETDPRTGKDKWKHEGMVSGFYMALEMVERACRGEQLWNWKG